MTNWSKIIGGISVALGLIAVALPIPPMYKVYILGSETIINGLLQYWQGNPQPSPAVTAAK